MTNTMRDEALALAGQGWHVFPVKAGSKAPPLIDSWQTRASCDPDQVSEWWGRWPTANIGIAAGPSGVVVVDLDRHGAVDGLATWAELCELHGLNGSETGTATVNTPSGGRHLYYAAPEGLDLTNTAGSKLGPGIDTRAGAGYVVAPPSIVDGRPYTWGDSGALLPLPAAILDLLTKAQPTRAIPPMPASERDLSPYVRAALDQEVLAVTRASEGERNDQLNRAAYNLGQLTGAAWAQLDRATVESELERAACACGLDQDPNCGPRGIEKTIRSGLDAGERDPRPEPPDRAPSPPVGTEPAAEVGGDHEQEPKMPGTLGQRLSGPVADYVKGIAPEIPDNRLRDAITAALLETRPVLGSDGQPTKDRDGNEKRRAVPALLKRRTAGQLLLDWLADRGGFVQDTSGRAYYFYEPGRRLFALDSALWAGFLYAASGVNPASTDYAHLKADCETAAMGAPKREIVKLACWDAESEVLRVSRFDGTVYALDGETITEESNGQNALFDDSESWTPYEPDPTGNGAALLWSTTGLPNFEASEPGGDPEQARALWGLAYRAWVLSAFFSELCPTRPLCVFLGEKGSGKSMALRVLLRLLFGPGAQISGVPDKPDSFTAAAAAQHVMVLDNLDTFSRWLRDKLARIATGADDTLRELYTTNETRRISYRCWVGITTREPDTLQRDDLADRLLVLPVDRLLDDQRQSETSFYAQVGILRGLWWGDVLRALNQAVASIRAGKLGAHKSRLRLADWEFLGRIFAENEGRADLWSNGDGGDTVVSKMLQEQSDLLLEGDPLVEGLRLWLNAPKNAGRRLPVRELHGELQTMLYKDAKPPSEWYSNTRALGRHIKRVRHDLSTLFDLEETTPTSGEYHHITCYQFWPKGTKPEQEELL